MLLKDKVTVSYTKWKEYCICKKCNTYYDVDKLRYQCCSYCGEGRIQWPEIIVARNKVVTTVKTLFGLELFWTKYFEYTHETK